MQPFPCKYITIYVSTERDANKYLENIVSGEVGLDTEYTKRRPTAEEKLIEESLLGAGGSKQAAILRWQIVETNTGKFSVA